MAAGGAVDDAGGPAAALTEFVRRKEKEKKRGALAQRVRKREKKDRAFEIRLLGS